MFIDVHAHLIDEKFANPQEVLERANFFGVNKIICTSSNIETSEKALEFAAKHENVFCAVGVHPEDVEEYNENIEKKLEEFCKNKNVVAVGEIGLDYHYENCDKEKQKEVFLRQILLADRVGLPIQIHCRDAMEDCLKILKDNKDKISHGGIFHCYSGSVEEAKEILKLGFSFSFGGVCTFKNARKVVEVIEFLELENILLETDSPYLAPEPYRGEINEPKNIPIIAEKIAQIKNMQLEDVASKVAENAKRIFGI